MSRFGSDVFTFCHIIGQRIFNLRAEVDDDLLAAFSVDSDAARIKIHIIYIQADAFGDTYSGSKQECH